MGVRLRLVAALLGAAFALTACGGGGGKSILGGTVPGGGTTGQSSRGNVQFTLTIPGGASTSSATRRTPQTVSAQTQSITVSVNGGAPQVFNAAAPTCTGTSTITCTLSVGAPFGLDSFLILTYSGTNGTGTTLNAAAVTLSVTSGGSNTASATAGNVLIVNNATDASGGSYSCAGGTTTCTLREAIAEASTTAGVYTAILFQGVTAIALTSPIEIGSEGAQNIILIGPGATAANSSGIGAPQASSGLTIGGGNATQIFYVNSGSLTVDGLTLANGNSSDNYGGAIENYGTLAIVNAIFSGNGGSNTDYGGAVYDESATNDTSTVIASTFTNNTALQYGGAYDDEDGASFSHCLFSGNVAYSSEYDYDLEGGAIYGDWDLSVDTSTFTGNAAGGTTVSGVDAYGGAISIEDNSMSPSITNSTFGGSSASLGNFAGGTGSTDEAYGGAVYNDGDYPLTLSGNTFASNIAKGGNDASGGAITDYEGIASTGDTFTNNVADGTATTDFPSTYGGAVYTEYTSSWTSDTFTGNQALAGNGATEYGEAYGGGIYAEGYDVTASQTTFSNNTANGGPFEADGGGLYADDYDGSQVTLSSVQFTNNTATAGEYAYGGGLEVDYATVTFTSLTFTGNSATISGSAGGGEAYGGGFEFYDGGNTGCGKCSVAQRPAPDAAATKVTAGAQHRAGMFATDQAREASAFTRNQALKARHLARKSKHAAAALAQHKAPAASRRPQIAVSPPPPSSSAITGTAFTSNTASGGSGGDAYGGGADLSGPITITATTFTNNVATVSGAESYAAGGGFSNSGNDDGYCGTVAFTGTLTTNSATNAGGGMWNYCAGFSVAMSTISGNKVTAVQYDGDGGGGIQNWYGTMTLSQSTVNGNSVAGSGVAGAGGGGVMNYDGPMTIVNSTVYNNTSSLDGGGIENGAGDGTGTTLTVIAATIYQNTATGVGGSLNNQAGSGNNYVYSANSILAGGTASSQSDIYNADNFTSEGYNLVQQGSNYGPGTSNAPQTGDIIGQSPVLGALGSNGGPTQTVGDAQSSPGRAHIPFSAGLCNGATGTSVDQRGYARGSGGFCDVGAYEFAGTAP